MNEVSRITHGQRVQWVNVETRRKGLRIQPRSGLVLRLGIGCVVVAWQGKEQHLPRHIVSGEDEPLILPAHLDKLIGHLARHHG